MNLSNVIYRWLFLLSGVGMRKLLLGVLALVLIAGAPAGAASPPDCEDLPAPPDFTRVVMAVDSVDGAGAQAASNQGEGAFAWHPRGGNLTLDVSSSDSRINLADASVILVCFRRQEGGAGPKDYLSGEQIRVLKQSPTELRLGVVVPRRLPPAPSLLDALISHVEPSRHTGFGVVPVVDVRVLAYAEDKSTGGLIPLLDTAAPIGVTSHIVSTVLAGLGGVGTLLILAAIRGPGLPQSGSFLRIIANPDGSASLSQFQIILWTMLVGCSAIYVMALGGNLIDISSGTLTLLGISGAAALGANLKARQDAAGAPAEPAKPQATPRWADLVLGGDRQIDMSRVQMMFFTCVSATFVGLTVATREIIPPIPDTYLLLMGISNGVYFLNKYTVPPG